MAQGTLRAASRSGGAVVASHRAAEIGNAATSSAEDEREDLLQLLDRLTAEINALERGLSDLQNSPASWKEEPKKEQHSQGDEKMELNAKLDTPEARAAYAREIKKVLGHGQEPEPAPAQKDFDLNDIRPNMSAEDTQNAASAIVRALKDSRE